MTREPCYKGKPLMFAGVMSRSYVAFYLFPVYMYPELLAAISPELRRRMQGKTCWNFTRPDAPLFAELAALVEAGFQRFQAAGYV